MKVVVKWAGKTGRYFWNGLREPRVQTFFVGLIWATLFHIGVAAILEPPNTVAHEIGPVLTDVWAISFVVGGTLGFIGTLFLPDWWWIERLGIISTLTGTLIYLTVVVSLHYTQPGNRLVQAGFILLAILQLLSRWVKVSGPQLDPTKGMPSAGGR